MPCFNHHAPRWHSAGEELLSIVIRGVTISGADGLECSPRSYYLNRQRLLAVVSLTELAWKVSQFETGRLSKAMPQQGRK
ncbi:hypothetical protein EVAR_100148_1 [Eumeta japonica]|uniref:Uncharacterized protein n=1 Tax=Eumeta variegata TaxID=151549 RepID=A0A4C1ZWG1_EUMVA|nr:hypothetical protein EVAR_100148_1 [Eumeta japonica]